MSVGGEKVCIDKNLFLSLPNIDKLSGVYFLTEGQTGRINFITNGDNIVVDLLQMDLQLERLILTTRQTFLKAWQIVLIVVLVVLVIAAVVLTVILIRKRKRKEYSVHEKI